MDSIFKKHGVILAHCLTKFGGAGNEYSIDKNIFERIILAVNEQLELSVSTIKSGDTYTQNNFFGPVGLILKNSVITYADSSDEGTMVKRGEFGKRDFILTPTTEPTAVNIEKAITNRSKVSYNELCAKSYTVFGLFICLDDSFQLSYNIGTEKTLYEHLKPLKLRYFILHEGRLHPAEYSNEFERFNGYGEFPTEKIYD